MKLKIYYTIILTLCASISMFAQGDWTIYNTDNSGLPYDDVYSTTSDQQGGIWVGTAYGLGYFDGENWMTFRTDNSGLPDNSIRALLLDKNGHLWIGTFLGGLVKYDGTNWTVYNISNSGLEDNFIRILVMDNEDILWIGTSGGLHSFDGSNWEIYNMNNSNLISNNIASLAIDSENTLWAGTINGGLARLKDDNISILSADNTTLTDNTILDIFIDEADNKWLACPAGGLNIFDNNNQHFYYINLNSDICDNSINTIAQVHETTFLGMAAVGICTFGDWTNYNIDNSPLTTNTVRDITIQQDSILWMSMDNGGLIKFIPDITIANTPVSALPNIRIFPNPATEFIHIDTPLHTSVRLYDTSGRLLYSNENVSITPTISVNKFPAGIYFLELIFEEGRTTKKIVIK